MHNLLNLESLVMKRLGGTEGLMRQHMGVLGDNQIAHTAGPNNPLVILSS